MAHATIRDARAMQGRCNADAALVITFTEGRVGVASYGRDRRLCKAARSVADTIFLGLVSGEIEVPAELDVGGGQ